jgi:hypothetical protein
VTFTEDELFDLCDGDEDFTDVKVPYDEIRTHTEKAVLFIIDGGEYWVPKSQMTDITADEVWVRKWFAEKEGLDG